VRVDRELSVGRERCRGCARAAARGLVQVLVDEAALEGEEAPLTQPSARVGFSLNSETAVSEASTFISP
jgi:hypothetical protein